jgi:hypothetical protein
LARPVRDRPLGAALLDDPLERQPSNDAARSLQWGRVSVRTGPVGSAVWVEQITEARFVPRTIAEPVDSQHRCGSGQFHKDLDIVVKGGAGGVRRPEEQARLAFVLKGEDLGMQSGERPAGIVPR